MIGGTPAYATPTPLISPTTSAIPMISGMIHTSFEPSPSARNAVSTAAPATVAGIERSMPPVSMHSVWPKPTSPMNDALIRIVRTWA